MKIVAHVYSTLRTLFDPAVDDYHSLQKMKPRAHHKHHTHFNLKMSRRVRLS